MPAPNLAPELGSPQACINSNYSNYFKLDRVLTGLDALGLQGHKPMLSNPRGCSEPDFALWCVHPTAIATVGRWAHLKVEYCPYGLNWLNSSSTCSLLLHIVFIRQFHLGFLLVYFVCWRLFAALFSIQGLMLFWLEWSTSYYLTELRNATSPNALFVV